MTDYGIFDLGYSVVSEEVYDEQIEIQYLDVLRRGVIFNMCKKDIT